MALLIEDESLNAVASWLLVLALAASGAWIAATSELLWGAFALASAAVLAVPAAVTREWTVAPDWAVVALVVFPFVLGQYDPDLPGTSYVALAALALAVAVELDAFSTAEFTPWFAVAFVVLTTMTLAGLWGVGQFAADRYLGTHYLAGLNDLMWGLVTATGVSVGAGLLFELVFREREVARRTFDGSA
ncbi:MAG: hypothetical protein ABEJ31_15495 [Haloarculaceae archaeon]